VNQEIPVDTTVSMLQMSLRTARYEKDYIGFVPTMGALHAGHAALVRAAKKQTAFVVVSVFVNPTQFGPNEDFAKYPRTLKADAALCAEAGADLIFAPSAEEMYPLMPPLTTVDVSSLGDHLCGASRPGHFRGVCTVVLKLLNVVQPSFAFFGAKDYQQAAIIRRMVRDLNVNVGIEVVPTVREPDGLALSSRNRYLSAKERKVAPGIYAALQAARERAQKGRVSVSKLQDELRAALSAIPGAQVDYASVVDADTLQPLAKLDRPAVAAVAVFLGKTRLIDNIALA
jgi:pantoate--beta-alanine ligase